ncbi:MAG: excinuclease ABC subunit UvrC [Oscillospiraceae bacterium]|nr:excinuclease ABC subunit UvrC [Oscillospiraceae bacterium]
MKREELLQAAESLPLLPGVYLMMDKTGLVIYVGKAKKLKNRVSQYFQSSARHNEKTRMMVSQVEKFDTIVVRSEFEALILENSLIKRHQPRFNILLKDDKGYPFVRMDRGEEYPRFTFVSKAAEDGAQYFGPFGGRHETRQALQAVSAALKLPTCSRRFPRDIGKERPCLNFHIGKCDGFCRTDGPDGREYRRRMEQAADLFSGKLRQVTASLQREMEQAAEEMAFEKAAALRDRIRALTVLSKQQQVIAGVCADTDVWGVYSGAVKCGAAVLHIEDGDLLGREVEVFSTAADSEEQDILAAVLSQYYLRRDALPREILLPCDFEDSDVMEQALSERVGRKVRLHVPQRGERSHLVDMARQNAREEVERITTESERVSRTLADLQKLASLPELPRRMESYDISHLGGEDTVASMVVFAEGKPMKRDYRKFSVETVSGGDDYGAMYEVLLRRLSHGEDETFPPLPDVLLIDGGVGQVHAALAAQQELGVFVPTLGMVKDDKHRTRGLVNAAGEELGISQSPHIFALIGRIQEETHRFALSFQQQKRKKRTFRSRLDGVAGLGPARKKALMKHFGTVRAIASATEEELSAVLPGAVAQALWKQLHEK